MFLSSRSPIVGAISVLISDGLEIHAGYAGSLSNLFAAASHLRATRAKGAAKSSRKAWREMVVTMQETFAGIRVIKSFAREAHQEKEFKRSNQMQFSQMMRIIRSMEATSDRWSKPSLPSG